MAYKFSKELGIYDPNNFILNYGDGENQPTWYSEPAYGDVKTTANFDTYADWKNAVLGAGGTAQDALDYFWRRAQFTGYNSGALGINGDQAKQQTLSYLNEIAGRAGITPDQLLEKMYPVYGKQDGFMGQYTGGWGWWGPAAMAIGIAENSGIPENFISPLRQTASQQQSGIGTYGTSMQNAAGDHGSFLSNVVLPTLAVAAPAIMGGGGLFGGAESLFPGESAVAGSGVWSGGNPIGGGGMWDWLDSIVGNTTDTGDWWSEYGLTSDPTATSAGWSSNPSMSDLTGGVLNNSGGASWWSQLPPDVLKTGGQIAQKLGQTAAESFLRDASAKLTGGSGRGILDQFQNDPLGSAFNATPFLLALAQANKQAGDIDGVLSKINGEGYTQAVLHPYDLATGQGRTALEQSLSDRGVAGSSFGYNDLSNFDYMRNLGRGDLANKAQMASAGLEGSLINTRNTNSNLLLGAGLNASGQLFSPKKDPFGLGNLGLASLLG